MSYIYYDTTGVVLKEAPRKIVHAFRKVLKDYNEILKRGPTKDFDPQYAIRSNYLLGQVKAYLAVYDKNGYFLCKEICDLGIKDIIKSLSKDTVAATDSTVASDTSIPDSNSPNFKLRLDAVLRAIGLESAALFLLEKDIYERTKQYIRLTYVKGVNGIVSIGVRCRDNTIAILSSVKDTVSNWWDYLADKVRDIISKLKDDDNILSQS